jgi:hypothetical protein
MIVDGKYHDGVTPESALEILGALTPEAPSSESSPAAQSKGGSS